MAWTIEWSATAVKQLGKLDRGLARQVVAFMEERVARAPRAAGKALRGELGEFWRYRVGDLRVVASIEDQRVCVVVVKVGHRREVYR